eukprot:10581785-Ditylum_brightwellii.AAC.1
MQQDKTKNTQYLKIFVKPSKNKAPQAIHGAHKGNRRQQHHKRSSIQTNTMDNYMQLITSAQPTAKAKSDKTSTGMMGY